MKRKTKEIAKATGSGVAGGAAGAGFWTAFGNGGLAIAGGATAVTVGWFVAAGAVVGLAGYGIYRAVTAPDGGAKDDVGT